MSGSANPSGAVTPTQNAYSPALTTGFAFDQSNQTPMQGAPATRFAFDQSNQTPMQGSSATGATPVAPRSTTPNVYNTASNLYNQAAAGPNINQFMNPYSGMVTATTLQDLERQRQMQMNDIGAQATRAGAFGGSRHGVAEALTNQGFAQQGANTFANLNQQGFNTALNAAQNQQNIQSNLAGQGFGFGNVSGAQQTAQGQAQQQTNQALIDAIKAQYSGFTGSPNAGLASLISAISGQPNQSTSTQTTKNNPGLLNIIGALASL